MRLGEGGGLVKLLLEKVERGRRELIHKLILEPISGDNVFAKGA
jgi:hypothetical protein